MGTSRAAPYINFISNADTITDSSKYFGQVLKTDKLIGKNGIIFPLHPSLTPFKDEFIKMEAKEFGEMKVWAQPYFNLYDQILSNNGVPNELKYLSVIESHLQSKLVSWAGAVGPWQLMADVAQRFGLRTGGTFDERTNFTRSTEVAAKVLKELYNEFGDWLLVVAAYNCGEGCVSGAVSKAGTKDFWKLQFYLPEETRNHVKKYIATHYYFEGNGGWTTLTADETKKLQQQLAALQNTADSTVTMPGMQSLSINGRYNAAVVSNNLLMDIIQFNNLNPGFDETLKKGQSFMLRLPPDKMDLFKAKRQQILQESVQAFLMSVTN